ncbi:Uma2 family endonuclease [Cyanobacteria bacterium FACHB-DQ100]|nr:Uma2 family endonuclease [Cyanobacteria bacterium FACHB-DQ100]
MTQAKPRFKTIEEYLDYDDGADTRYELVDGVLVEMPPESRLNQKIASFLFGAFVRLGISTDLLVIGIQIAITSRKVTARQPDFVVLTEECAIALEGMKTAVITGAMPPPSLVVEVVSPGEPGTENYDRDYIEKPSEYAARRIPEFWQVDPHRAVVRVLSLDSEEYQAREFRGSDRVVSQTFPDLQLTAEQILRAGR